jgi:peptide/nickel transport system permease protein
MAWYMAWRLASAIPVLLFVSIVVFLTTSLIPGDAADAVLRGGISKARADAIRSSLHLNEPLPARYWHWLVGILHGDLGSSWITDQPVTGLIKESLPKTFEILLATVLIGTVTAVAVGIFAAMHEGGLVDRTIMTITLIGVSVPGYWIGILLLLVFAVETPLFPVGGLPSIGDNPTENLHSLFLPALTLSFAVAPPLARFVRSGMLEALHEDYVRTARAKGLAGRRVILRHAMRNALLPVLTYLGLLVGALIGGDVITEVIFGIPGIGGLGVNAVFKRDIPVLQGVVLLMATAFVVVNLLVDVASAFLDPRIRHSSGGLGL